MSFPSKLSFSRNLANDSEFESNKLENPFVASNITHILNILVIILGHFTFFAFNFTSSEFLIASIGETFDAFLADFLHDSHIVIIDPKTLIAIAIQDILYVNKVPFDI